MVVHQIPSPITRTLQFDARFSPGCPDGIPATVVPRCRRRRPQPDGGGLVTTGFVHPPPRGSPPPAVQPESRSETTPCPVRFRRRQNTMRGDALSHRAADRIGGNPI